MEYVHTPVMLHECIEGLNIKGEGIYIDGTLGGGGHSLEIVRRLTTGRLIANDKDIQAIEATKKRLESYNDKITYIYGDYKDLENKIEQKPDGILLDLGISSMQIDNAERGFSYMSDAPLDMRMDQNAKRTAKDVVNKYTQQELVGIIRKYGEDNFAPLIARAIIKARSVKPIETTIELSKIIEESIPHKFRWVRGHPSKKTFQAIRIEVNGELDLLYETILNLARTLKPEGRMCIISFHSLEDRIVKNAYKYLELDCICDKSAPICICDKVKEAEILTHKPITPKAEELENNSRAASAKLRILKKL